MNRLIAELQRLYFLPNQQCCEQTQLEGSMAYRPGEAATPELLARSLAGQGSVALDLISPDGMTRTLAIVFEKAADWGQVAKLYQGVQEDLELPAPAISVSGRDGYHVWFSLADAVPAQQAREFLDGLRLKYLADMPPGRLQCRPDAPGKEDFLDLVPSRHGPGGKWSAFIEPAMGSMFSAEPGLEMAPNPDKQADLLAGFESIKAGDFLRALGLLRPPAEAVSNTQEPSPAPRAEAAGRQPSTLSVGSNFSDPKSFLLAVMNDPSASAGQRIKAAKALLPYFEKPAIDAVVIR